MKKFKFKTVYAVLEGEVDENSLFIKIFDLFRPFNSSRNINSKFGGHPDSLLDIAIRNCFKYDLVILWIDEDKDLSKERRDKLINLWQSRNPEIDINEFHLTKLANLQERFNPNLQAPVLIVSNPVCFEGQLLKLFGCDKKRGYAYNYTELEFKKKLRQTQVDKCKQDFIRFYKEQGFNNSSDFIKSTFTQELILNYAEQNEQMKILIEAIKKLNID